MSKVKYVPLHEVATFKGGSTPHRQNQKYFGGGIPWVKTTDLNNSLIVRTEETLTELGLKESSCKMIDAGAVLVAMYGGFNQIGRTGVLTQKSAINQALTAVIPDPNRLNPIFLNEWLNYRVKYWKRFAVSSRKDPNITKSDVEDFPVPVLDIDYQNKAVDVLQTWTNAIETTERLIAAKERYFDGLAKKLLDGSMRYAEFDDQWQEIHLGDLGSTYNGLSGKTGDDFGSGNSKYITYKNIFDNVRINSSIFESVAIDSKETQNKVKFGDIFFTVSSETPNEVGMSSVLLESVDNVYLNSFCFGFRLTNFEILSPSFAQFYFRSFAMRDKISRLAQGSTRFNLSKSEMIKIKMHLPSIQEQTKIAEVLNTAKREIDLLKKLAESYRLQKRGLMQKLLSGEWRVAA